MSEVYGLKEYKVLLEKNLREMRNPMSSPFGTDPFSVQETLIRHAKMDSINYALEMLPEIPEPMKDHVFREQVNDLRDLVNTYSHTEQLRAQLVMFLHQFRRM